MEGTKLTLWRRHWLGHPHHNRLLLSSLVHARGIVLLHAVHYIMKSVESQLGTGSTYLRMRNCTFFGVALMRSCAWASVSCVASSSFISSMMSPSRTPDLSAIPLGVTCQVATRGKVTITFYIDTTILGTVIFLLDFR